MNIVIADAHTLCREALTEYIRHADQSMSVSGVGDYAALMEHLGGEEADFLLLDVHLPGLPMIGNFSDFNSSFPALRIGLMVPPAHEDSVETSSSTQGFFPKTLSCKTFLQGIKTVMNGERFVPEVDNVSYLPAFGSERSHTAEDYHLTTREKQVLSHLVQGQTNKDIARALDLQVVTVKLHVRGICRKIGAKNRTQAALLAQENGWSL